MSHSVASAPAAPRGKILNQEKRHRQAKYDRQRLITDLVVRKNVENICTVSFSGPNRVASSRLRHSARHKLDIGKRAFLQPLISAAQAQNTTTRLHIR
jgi:hypothetical protein